MKKLDTTLYKRLAFENEEREAIHYHICQTFISQEQMNLGFCTLGIGSNVLFPFYLFLSLCVYVVHHTRLCSMCYHTVHELGKGLEIETQNDTQTET